MYGFARHRQTARSAAGSIRLMRGITLILLIIVHFEGWSDSRWRCASSVISSGDDAARVRGVCGAPALRDVQPQFDPRNGQRFGDTEVWTYNLGSHQLLRLLRFRNGRLVDIATEGYGFTPPAVPGCAAHEPAEGWSKYRLLARCGEPADKRAMSLLSQAYRHDGRRRPPLPDRSVTAVYREEWTYNFGADSLLRRVLLENGIVVDIEDDGRGYDAR